LRDGEEFPIGENPPSAKLLIEKLRSERIARWKPAHDWSSTARRAPVLRYLRGADSGRFVESTLQLFKNEGFFVSPDSDRMGIRMDGPRLERSEDVDLLSEAVAPGTVQVPPNGHPILLLNDCQTIGGYPKIGHVITVDLPVAAQLCPGDRVRFSEVSIADAHALLLERERNLEQFRRGLESHFK
jgi:antagonist of KipI